jgi:hypothetical protein
MDGGEIMIGCIPTPEEARTMLRNSVAIRMPDRDGWNRVTKLQDDAQAQADKTGEDYNVVLAKLAKRRKIEVTFYDSKGNPVGDTPPVKVITPEAQEVLNVLKNLPKNSK